MLLLFNDTIFGSEHCCLDVTAEDDRRFGLGGRSASLKACSLDLFIQLYRHNAMDLCPDRDEIY